MTTLLLPSSLVTILTIVGALLIIQKAVALIDYLIKYQILLLEPPKTLEELKLQQTKEHYDAQINFLKEQLKEANDKINDLEKDQRDMWRSVVGSVTKK